VPKGIPNVPRKEKRVIPTDPNFQEYPKMLYLLGDVANHKVVNSADEEDALGSDWEDSPSAQVPTE